MKDLSTSTCAPVPDLAHKRGPNRHVTSHRLCDFHFDVCKDDGATTGNVTAELYSQVVCEILRSSVSVKTL